MNRTSEFARGSEDGTLVDAWVVPGASTTEIVGLHDGAVRVRVAAPPERGKANRAVAEALQRSTGATKVELVRGANSRRKTLLLTGVSAQEARKALVL